MPADFEFVGALEYLRVAVGRADQEDQAVARLNRDFPDLAVFHRHTEVALHRAVETQHLFHRRVDFPGLFAQALQLSRMLE